MPDSNVNLVIAGDSIGLGQVTSTNNWADLNINSPYTVENMSVNGVTLHYQSTGYEAGILQQYSQSSPVNWLVVQVGTNDLGQGTSATDLYNELQSFTADAHRVGFRVLVATVLPRNNNVFSWTSDDEANRLAYNQLVRQNSVGADAIADLASDPVMGNPASTSQLPLYIDGLHPSGPAVKTYLEPIYSAALEAADNKLTNDASAQVSAPASVTTTSANSAASIPNLTPSSVEAATMTAGSGSDKIVLKLSEDAFQGDAQYTVSVDGQQIGGIFSAQSLRAAGQDDSLTVLGNWNSGAHSVSVNFLNDAYGGSASADRNLYVDGATIDGTTVPNSSLQLYSAGAQSFSFEGTATTESAVSPMSTPSSTPSDATTVGSGPDELDLKLNEFVYGADAQFTVSVDGKQIGDVLTTHAAYTAGQNDAFSFLGDWGAGNHSVSIDVLNNPADPARQVFLNGATYNGTSVAESTYAITPGDQNQFVFQDTPASNAAAIGSVLPTASGPMSAATPTAPAMPAASIPPSSTSSSTPSDATTVGSGPDELDLKLNEFVYGADAQFTVSVDGKQIGDVLTTHAAYTAGQNDAFSFLGDWGAGNHSVSIDVLNNPADPARQVFLNGATYNGTSVAESTHAITPGAQNQFVF